MGVDDVQGALNSMQAARDDSEWEGKRERERRNATNDKQRYQGDKRMTKERTSPAKGRECLVRFLFV